MSCVLIFEKSPDYLDQTGDLGLFSLCGYGLWKNMHQGIVNNLCDKNNKCIKNKAI